ncbi:alcohol dehydrogenase [Algimonas ampicilliniresistens]|uniref:Alcohol dehydrogenase n=1 Tax=Algimonas ampicilliniresistens TaxID=1298735 RepID=A0ABQ5VAB8_9PROT|nr:NAD(P)-dependent alcohol dehydrogenase [Algimonas ampicilliniresistens]GLQ23511.1 alcohol dehydrogenase [Algimonas ampicilliniresistens]
MADINAYAARESGGTLAPFTYDPGPIGAEEVEIRITACGLCHSDISMINNDWRASQYPLVPGHEVVGEIAEVGSSVTHLKVGQMVGVGWTSHSCQHCSPCLSGRQQRCETGTSTIAGRGGFADRIRVQHIWAVPLPDGLDAQSAGPLFCGGITVFAPFLDFDLKPTDRVGIIGIGGLGHLAVQFANAWGCEVTAFTSSMDKEAELKELGAHRIVNSRDEAAIKAERGYFDYILTTVNVSLPWALYMRALRSEGKLITVGVVPEPMAIPANALIGGQRMVAGSDTGPPEMVATMLEFCVRHDIKPMIETFPMSDCNEAIERLESGKARYRIVLENS